MERVASTCAYTGSLVVLYEYLGLVTLLSNHDAKPNIVDAPLMLILPQADLQHRTVLFGIVYQSWSWGSCSVQFMYVQLYCYIVL
jgi:hypothetical protein